MLVQGCGRNAHSLNAERKSKTEDELKAVSNGSPRQTTDHTCIRRPCPHLHIPRPVLRACITVRSPPLYPCTSLIALTTRSLPGKRIVGITALQKVKLPGPMFSPPFPPRSQRPTNYITYISQKKKKKGCKLRRTVTWESYIALFPRSIRNLPSLPLHLPTKLRVGGVRLWKLPHSLRPAESPNSHT